jgi:two-component system response regulator QseB
MRRLDHFPGYFAPYAPFATLGAFVHILLIEDDPLLGKAIQRALEQLAYTLTWVRDGREAMAAVNDPSVDLILLDLGLPNRDGFEILTEARGRRLRTPIIVMTARDDLESRIRGLDAGADDYMVKPFHLDELAARIRSTARRANGMADNRIEVGPLVLNAAAVEVSYQGRKVELSRREFALLQYLMERAGRVVRREQLESSLYGWDNDVGSGALDVLVHGLRRKLSFDAIKTVRGFGYTIPLDHS